jgi:exonuclease SbcC
MKIRELFIKRYGPLREKSYTLANPFTLLMGNNEEGKTLTIDALVRLLLGKHVKGFEKIDRVEEIPEGYVVIEDDHEGSEMKLPEQGTLTDFTGITSSEYRNIFVIRDSDLSIPGEGEFYTTVTNRLTGLRTAEIIRIKEVLREIGRLTPGGIFLDVKEENLRTRLEAAATLIVHIEGLFSEMREGKFDELEGEAVHFQEEMARIALAGEQLEDARKREKYTKGKEALDRLGAALQEASTLKKFTEGDAQQWRDGERDIRHYDEEKDALAAKLKANEQEIRGLDKTLSERTREFRIFEERKKPLDEVKAELGLIETKRKEGAEREQKAATLLRLGVIACILLAISLIGLIIRPSLPFYIATPVFFIAVIAFWTPQLRQVRERAWQAGALTRIKLALAKFKWKADAAEDIYARLQEFDEELRKRWDEIQELTRRKENLAEAIGELHSKTIPSVQEKIKAVQALIEEIRVRSGTESRQAHQHGLTARQWQETSARDDVSILRGLLGAHDETILDNMTFWQQALKALEQYRDAAQGITYDEATVTLMKKSRAAAEANLATLLTRMAGFRKRLDEVEKEAHKILQSETDYLPCATMTDLEAIRARLGEFIDSHEETRDTALKVITIFDEIETEERRKVAELFGEESPVARYFSEITDGLYQTVLFNQGTGGIEVRRRDGTLLDAQQLSGGAYDQLYLAIRLTLAEKVLQGKKGFFIMDDPFIKADPERLERQLAMLCRIAEQGWQIIYFSAKGEIKEILKRQISKGAVHYTEIQRIFS